MMMDRDRRYDQSETVKTDLQWDDVQVVTLNVDQLSVLSPLAVAMTLKSFSTMVATGELKVVNRYNVLVAYRKMTLDELHAAALDDNARQVYTGLY
jgi:hypothetical protein